MPTFMDAETTAQKNAKSPLRIHAEMSTRISSTMSICVYAEIFTLTYVEIFPCRKDRWENCRNVCSGVTQKIYSDESLKCLLGYMPNCLLEYILK